MKKIIAALVAVWMMIGCNQPKSKQQEETPVIDTDSIISKPTIETDSTQLRSKDTTLLQLSTEILNAIKRKDFVKFASYFHPTLGVRFSPYAFVDTVSHQHIMPTQLITISQQKKILVWGTHDGSGEVIKQNINKYFDEFVYDADFINAPQKAVNKILGSGNSLNNLETVYPNADFTELYFPAFDPKYGGMDWKTLRLVFQIENNKPWLIAIIHDEWTI